MPIHHYQGLLRYLLQTSQRLSERFAFLRGNWRLVVFWPLAAVVVGIIGWLALLNSLERELASTERHALEEAAILARGYADQLTRTVEAMDHMLLHIRYEWKLNGRHLDLEASRAEGILPSSVYFNVGIVDRDGIGVFNTLGVSENAQLADRPYFFVQQAADKDELYIGEAAEGRSTRRAVVHFSRRLSSADGSFDGVVRLSVAPEYLTASYDEVTLAKHGMMAVVGTDREIRALRVGGTVSDWHNHAIKRVALFGLPARQTLFASAGGSAKAPGPAWFEDGRNRYVGWHQVAGYPLVAVMALDEATTLAPYRSMRENAMARGIQNTAILALFTLIAMALSLRLAWRKHQLQVIQAAYRIATEEGNEGFYIVRPIHAADGRIADFRIIDCNQTGAEFYATTPDRMIGRSVSDLYASDDELRPVAMHCLAQAVQAGIFEDDFHAPRLSKWFHVRAVRSGSMLAVTLQDVTAEREHVQALERKGNEDALTGMPNRHWLSAFLPQALEHASAQGSTVGVLFVDLDGFKVVNDSAGHEAGDELLKAAARRIRLAVRPGDHVVRIGGDEFVVITENLAGKGAAAPIAQRILGAFGENFRITKGIFSVGASIGISVYPDDGMDAKTLLNHADIAMYSAKTAGKHDYRFFDARFYDAIRARHSREAELRHAVDQDQFVMYYQPRVDISTGVTCSMEALVRWAHPNRGIVEPVEFVPLAEESGLIVQLGELVIDKVCAQLAFWLSRGQELVPVSINVSARQFNEARVAERLSEALQRHQVPAHLVEIELTESSMTGDCQEVSEALKAIQAMGINLAVDDFGTGYSSLSQLQRLDFDVLKVDRAFTAELEATREGAVFFNAIITMAHALGMRVVAEGVETMEQVRKLKELQCDEVQGFFISTPLPPSESQPILPKRLFSWVN
ncbi:diguanylate cyclase (GGDEF) domain-containing protein [Noviherbaspirillum humi]|uniref:Diguanylate cyclase (GGDEF) domain-containing protein n=1 Tax=Noviherbaspirillum humi TaxID=1688639 RepID=A0A239EW37_9BURK|nr:EAL domain-containing protein [Noviherbaspirillum humi]SNS48886.1 diguanylate cyclase (GGDEF) domain-containing protein [Noviherbaspirillum humi]